MTKVYSVANHKGGVGKTTSTATIGKTLSKMGKKVLLIDTDAQANLTSTFLNTIPQFTVFDSIVEPNGPVPLANIIVSIGDNLDLAPSSLVLASADYKIASRMAREQILLKLIKPIKKFYDYILIDCPPALSEITTNDLVASDGVLIPLIAETLPMVGLSMLESIINDVKELNEHLKIQAIFFTRFNNRNLNNEVVSMVTEKFGKLVMDTKIRECISVAEAPAAKSTVFEYAPSSNAAKDYTELVEELLSKGL